MTQSLVVCIPLMMMMLCVTLCCMRSDSICVNVDTHLTHCGTSSSSRAHYTMHLMHYVSRCTVKRQVFRADLKLSMFHIGSQGQFQVIRPMTRNA